MGKVRKGVRGGPYTTFVTDCFFRLRSWHPAIVMGLLDLPVAAQQQLGRNPDSKVVVKRFGMDDLRIVQPGRLEPLGENRVDKFRAAVSPEIGAAYDIALATQSGDI